MGIFPRIFSKNEGNFIFVPFIFVFLFRKVINKTEFLAINQ